MDVGGQLSPGTPFKIGWLPADMVGMGREPWCAWCGQKLPQDDQRRLVDGVAYHAPCVDVRERVIGPSWSLRRLRLVVTLWLVTGWSALLPLLAALGGLLTILLGRGSAQQ